MLRYSCAGEGGGGVRFVYERQCDLRVRFGSERCRGTSTQVRGGVRGKRFGVRHAAAACGHCLLPVFTACCCLLLASATAAAVLALSFSDLLQMARFMQALQNRVVNSGQLMGQDGWAYIMAGV